MPVTLSRQDGRSCLTVENARGKARTYYFRLARFDGGTVFILQEIGGKVRHQVSLTGDAWRCSCPDWLYRTESRRDGCKHVKAAQELAAVMTEFILRDGTE